MKTRRGHAVSLYLMSALCVACAPTPVVPSGAARIPVNSEEVIRQYREGVKVDHRDRVERNGLARQVDALTKQVQELKAYVTILQLQQQKSEKGRVPQAQHVGADSPPLGNRAPDKVPAKDKEPTEALAVPPNAAARSDGAMPPMVPIAEGPTDPCGQRPWAANQNGWIDLTSDYLNRSAGLRAAHGPCRSVSRSTAPSPGRGVWCSGICQAE